VPLILCAWTANASAHADFAPVAAPGAPGAGIAGFAASGSAWLTLCSTTGTPRTNVLRRSNDHGATWSDSAPALPDGAQPGPATAPDGAFAVLRLTGATSALDRVDPATGAVTTEPGPPPPSDLFSLEAAPPAWDGWPVLRGVDVQNDIVPRPENASASSRASAC
jgi:hypothetical protein